MVNWHDPATLQHQTIIFGNVVHFVSGLYAWETAVNLLSFDWSIISGKRPFRWPMLLYFACRYSMFFALVGILVALNTTREVNCQALYTFNQFVGNLAIGFASNLLMLRTIAVWDRNIWVIIPLVTVSLGQWAILLHGVTTVISTWNSQVNACIVVDSGTLSMDLIYFYTMSFDFVVLLFTVLGLYLSSGRSNLWKLLFTDGIIYFALAFFSNIFPAVFIALNLNPVMNIIFSVPAACVTSLFACRSFIRLATYSTPSFLPSFVQTSPFSFINHGSLMESIPGKYTSSSGPSAPTSTSIPGSDNSSRLCMGGHPTDTFDSAAGPHSNTAGADEATTFNGSVHVFMETFSQTIPQDEMHPPQEPQARCEEKHGAAPVQPFDRI